ncbi:hypothetical protein E4U21_004764 [Claviceps maximensis]|nr:hypothetical protein E4U21_004764 [Claviceps maximensis]
MSFVSPRRRAVRGRVGVRHRPSNATSSPMLDAGRDVHARVIVVPRPDGERRNKQKRGNREPTDDPRPCGGATLQSESWQVWLVVKKVQPVIVERQDIDRLSNSWQTDRPTGWPLTRQARSDAINAGMNADSQREAC